MPTQHLKIAHDKRSASWRIAARTPAGRVALRRIFQNEHGFAMEGERFEAPFLVVLHPADVRGIRRQVEQLVAIPV